MTTKEQLDRVQKLINFAAKVALGRSRKYDHATPFLKELKWLRFEKKIIYDVCVFMFNVVNKKFPEWLFSFPRVSDMIDRDTRQSDDLYVPRTRTDIGSRALRVSGPRCWNTLPDHIKAAPTSKSFQSGLKKFLLNEE